MPVPLPNLDDRTYADLMEEMKALIPRYAPEWTDHNESDPGIMLIELFAWLTEALIYRLNRIPEASELRFLELIGADLHQEAGAITDTPDLDDLRAQTVRALKRRWRAITAEDFEELVTDNSDLNIARAKCIPERDLTSSDPAAHCPGHVTVVVVPSASQGESDPVEKVHRFLNERRLITCRHHVIEAGCTAAAVKAEVAGDTSVQKERLKSRVMINLVNFFHPLTGGPGTESDGWPFGRDVYTSEVFQIIEETEGVEHVESLELLAMDSTGIWIDAGDSITVEMNNLVQFDAHESKILIQES